MIELKELNPWINRVDESVTSIDPPWLPRTTDNGSFIDHARVREALDRLYEIEKCTRPKGGEASAEAKDQLANEALAHVGELARHLAGWALNHKRGCALHSVKGPPANWSTEGDPEYLAAKRVVDSHSHEDRGAHTSAAKLPPPVLRRFVADVLEGISDGFDLPPSFVEGLIALDYGEITPVFAQSVSTRKRQYRELVLQLKAVCFVEFERAKGSKKYLAQEAAAAAFIVGTDAIRAWEYRLHKELGSLHVRSEMSLATRRGLKWKELRDANDPMADLFDRRFGSNAVKQAGSDFQALLRQA